MTFKYISTLSHLFPPLSNFANNSRIWRSISSNSSADDVFLYSGFTPFGTLLFEKRQLRWFCSCPFYSSLIWYSFLSRTNLVMRGHHFHGIFSWDLAESALLKVNSITTLITSSSKLGLPSVYSKSRSAWIIPAFRVLFDPLNCRGRFYF